MEEEEEHYLQNYDRKVRTSIWGTLGFFRLIGDLVGMFLPRVVDVVVMAAGGRGDTGNDAATTHRPPSLGPSPDPPGQTGPGTPDEEAPGR